MIDDDPKTPYFDESTQEFRAFGENPVRKDDDLIEMEEDDPTPARPVLGREADIYEVPDTDSDGERDE